MNALSLTSNNVSFANFGSLSADNNIYNNIINTTTTNNSSSNNYASFRPSKVTQSTSSSDALALQSNSLSNTFCFTGSEDDRLYKIIEKTGPTANWRDISKAVGPNRTEEMCHQRWNKELQPLMGLHAKMREDEHERLLEQQSGACSVRGTYLWRR